jgi:protein SCO1/2
MAGLVMIALKPFNFAVALLLAVVVAGCATKKFEPVVIDPNVPAADAPAAVPSGPFLQAFQVHGIIHELPADGRTAVISHEEIPGYMPAMIMPFTVKDTNELAGLQPGDSISFQLMVDKTNGWIEQLVKLDVPRVAVLPPALRVVKDVEPLNVGDLLPDYHFTNELGQAVSLAQFRGQALAITFIFTRCPFPTFCPLMSLNFDAVQNKLKALTNATANWHLLTLSFDPEYDTPATLKEYAGRYGYDPAHWSFLTGALVDITALTEQVGVQFWRVNPGEPISHNLRTVVVDPQGRVQKIIPNNDWTSDELVAELVKALAVK